MGKLATTSRLVTRHYEGQEASVWLLERSGASSDRAFVAVPIGGIEIRPAIAPRVGSRARVGVGVGIGIDIGIGIDSAAAERDACESLLGTAPSHFEFDARRRNSRNSRRSSTRRREDRERISAVEAEESSNQESECWIETTRTSGCGDGNGNGDEDSSSSSSSPSIAFPADIVREGKSEKCDWRVRSEWWRVVRKRFVERRRIVGLGAEKREHGRCRGRCRERWYRYRCQWLAGSKELSLLFGIARMVAVAAVAAVLCAPTASALPAPAPAPAPIAALSPENPLSGTGPRHDLDRSTGLEDVYEDAFEDVFREEDRQTSRTVLDESELDVIRRSIARGLGLERIPDPAKANVSQAEYERAHREYLMRMQLSLDEQTSGSKRKLHVFPATAYPGNESSRLTETSERERNYRHWLFFPVEIPEEDDDTSVDHATLRLLLHSPTTDDYSECSELVALLYLRRFAGPRKLIGRRRIELPDCRNSRWLDVDATAAVSSWRERAHENLGFELEFVVDGVLARRGLSSPTLNVFTVAPFAASSTIDPARARTKRSSPEQLMSLHKGRRTKCKGESKKCCRHELTVMFKDLKGFEFIVYPKTFDAGYCKGRCPPRYNPAHHHALLQSLLWKEDKKKVPKPCCAPSKLDQLMIVYFDENDSTQLKVSYWKNIQVLECACS